MPSTLSAPRAVPTLLPDVQLIVAPPYLRGRPSTICFCSSHQGHRLKKYLDASPSTSITRTRPLDRMYVSRTRMSARAPQWAVAATVMGS